jgi:ribulose-5-phosphate 4-epimerase/fuculose-1-phosphate aldolase
MKIIKSLELLIDDAVWAARSLFERNKTSGSSANISFRYENRIFISGSGSCFGTLGKKDFSELDISGNPLNGVKPSKEYPLHLAMYHKNSQAGAVIHTHSFYSVLWSCLDRREGGSVIPRYTPYLEMKLGNVGWIPYAPPGSKALFNAFEQVLDDRRGYLLANHGPIVCDTDLFAAFYALEELEESAHLAWELRHEGANIL